MNYSSVLSQFYGFFNKKTQLFVVYLLLMLFFSFSEESVAQSIKEFTHEKEAFFEELGDYMAETKERKLKKLVNEFYSVWDSGGFGSQQHENMYRIADLFLKRRASRQVYFKAYLEVLISFHLAHQPQDSFDAWAFTLNQMLSGRRALKLTKLYMVSTIEFLDNNTLCKTKRLSWQARRNGLVYALNRDSVLVVHVDKTDLVCFALGDSIELKNIEGYYYPASMQFEALMAKVKFPLADSTQEAAVAELSNFSLSLKTDRILADSVLYKNDSLFSEKVLGKFEYQLESKTNPAKRRFPHFESYATNLHINNPVPNSVLYGRLIATGNHLRGRAGDRNLLVIERNSEAFIHMRFGSYFVNSKRMEVPAASWVVRIGLDSIFHPKIAMNYVNGKRLFRFVNTLQNSQPIPFIDSYHELYLQAEMLSWYADSATIEISRLPNASYNLAVFSSLNHFNELEYSKYRNPVGMHPVVQMSKFVFDWGEDPFTIADYARANKMGRKENAFVFLEEMATLGYVIINYETEMVRFTDLLRIHLYANAEKGDFDRIKFASSTSMLNNNGFWDLNTNEFYIDGVRRIPVYKRIVSETYVKDSTLVFRSDTSEILLFPAGRKVVFEKHRNFRFNGAIRAGSFVFVGENFSFNYDDFLIKMDSVREMRVELSKSDSLGNKTDDKSRIKNYLEDVSGYLYIDSTDNKSGIRLNESYPIFTTTKPSYIYYNDSTINEVCYPKEQVYFEADTFTITGMFDFTTDDWRLNGTFESGGIIPTTYHTPLTVQTDSGIIASGELGEIYSFGIYEPTDSAGSPLYNGKGTLKGGTKVSSRGMRAVGELNYLTSYATSEAFLLEVDSMTALANLFMVERTDVAPNFPSVTSEMINLLWQVPQDSLIAMTKSNDLIMYSDVPFKNDTIKMTGSLIVTPEGLKGNGSVSFGNASMLSELYDFKSESFTADAQMFRYKLDAYNEPVFETVDTRVVIDLYDRLGHFTSIYDASFVQFSLNKYKAYMDKFDWLMDENRIQISTSDMASEKMRTNTKNVDSATGIIQTGSQYIQTNPKGGDTLVFFSKTGDYDFENLLLRINEPQLIRIADAVIFPNDTVVIAKHGVFMPLDKATVRLSDKDSLHRFVNCNIQIIDKYKYSGKGHYQFVDENTDTTLIYCSEFVQNARTTNVTGVIPDSMAVLINPYFKYYGKMHIRGDTEPVKMDGFVQINHMCDSLPKNYFTLQGYIKPDSIFIPVGETMKTNTAQTVYSGIYKRGFTDSIYTAFYSPKTKRMDFEFATAQGLLHYDKTDGYYKVGSYAKIKDSEAAGNLFALNRTVCIARLYGKPTFDLNLGAAKLQTAGRVSYDLESKEVDMGLMAGFDFHFSSVAMQQIVNMFAEDFTISGVDITRKSFRRNLVEFTDKKRADKIMKDLSTGNANQFTTLKYQILFSELNMDWDYETASYISSGNIGVATMGGAVLNKMLEGHVQIIKRNNSSTIKVYIEADGATWVFFSYKATYNNDKKQTVGEMFAYSSNAEFNTIVDEMKDKDRKPAKMPSGTDYSYFLGTKGKVTQFKDLFEE